VKNGEVIHRFEPIEGYVKVRAQYIIDSTVYGYAKEPDERSWTPDRFSIFKWTEEDGYTFFPPLEFTSFFFPGALSDSTARNENFGIFSAWIDSIDDNGNVIYGPIIYGIVDFQTSTSDNLDYYEGEYLSIFFVSENGEIAAGQGPPGTIRWTRQDGWIEAEGAKPNEYFYADAMAPDGSIIVGSSSESLLAPVEGGFVWTEENGLQRFNEMFPPLDFRQLDNAGQNLEFRSMAISADRRTIAGYGPFPGTFEGGDGTVFVLRNWQDPTPPTNGAQTATIHEGKLRVGLTPLPGVSYQVRTSTTGLSADELSAPEPLSTADYLRQWVDLPLNGSDQGFVVIEGNVEE